MRRATNLVFGGSRKQANKVRRTRRGAAERVRRSGLKVEALEARRVFAGDISGVVFDDLNGNGADDPSENGLPGWTVFIDSNRDGQLSGGEPSTTTDVKGRYAFVGLPAGATTVYEIPQDGYSPTTGFTDHQTVNVRDGKEARVKFPNFLAPVTTGTIVGTVFEDDNENGAKDSGEHGLEGWSVFLDTDGDGALTAGEPTTTTDADGDYRFAEVPAGPVTVYEIPTGGALPITGGLFPLEGASDHRSVTVVAGSSARANFPNLIPPVGTIQGKVWNDADGDGTRDLSESALADRTVFIDLNSNGAVDAGEPVRNSDASGNYSFVNIHTGTYRVTELAPAGWIHAVNRPGAVSATVTTGAVRTVDFFNLVPEVGSVAGRVWDDANGDGVISAGETGLAAWQVFVDSNANGAFDDGELTASTATDGSYRIDGVPYGSLTVREIRPANFVSTNPVSGAISILHLNGEQRTGLDFGNRENIGAIHGLVWDDQDGDGVRDATEAGLADRVVFLDLDGDGTLSVGERSAVTSATGAYEFTRVPVGTYSVVDVLPEGWITTIGKPTAFSTTVTIGGGHVADFFNLIPVAGSVSGTVYSDLDSNGAKAAAEPLLEGWQIYLDANGNGTLDVGESNATTDASGAYTLSNVPYGSQTLRAVTQIGFTPTNPSTGKITLAMLNGENRTGVAFGMHERTDYVISGVAFHDQNGNGVRDLGERGLSGIPVYLDLNDNGAQDAGEPSTNTSTDRFFTPTVDETGAYSFTHLLRGSYTVREVVPVEQSLTPDSARSLVVAIGPADAIDSNFANRFRANEIHGVVFDDTDLDHVRDANEYARPGVPIYVDMNRNDLYDAGEPRSVTADDGSYAFYDLTPGAYIVREESGMAGPHTYPATGGGILWPAGTSHAAVGNVTPAEITTSLSDGEVYSQTVSLTLPNAGGLTNMVDVFLLFDDTGSFTGNSPIVRAAFPDIIASLQGALPGVDLGFGVGRLEEYGSFASEFATGRPFILNQPIVASSTTGFSTAISAALDRMTPGYGGDGPETDIEALYQVVTGLGFDGNNNGTTSDSGPAGLNSTQVTPGNSGDVPSFASFAADPANNVLTADGDIGGAGFRRGALPIILTATDTGFAYQPKGEAEIIGDGGLALPVDVFTDASRASTPFSSGAGIQETVTGLNALGALVIGLGTNAEAGFAPREGLEALAKLTGAVNRSTTTIDNGTADPIAPGDPFYFQISSGFAGTVANGVINAIQNAVTNVALDITLRASDPRVRIINHTGTLTGVAAGQTASFDIEFIGDGRPHRFDLQFVRNGTNVVLGSIPVVLGTPVVGDGYSYDELDDGEIHQSSHFGNYVANVAPAFTAGTDQVVIEDAGSQVIAGWATNITAGGATESGQVVNFLVSTDNPALFSVAPAIAADGTLRFTPAANASGTALVVVQAHDNGGVGPDGADTSVAQTFSIEVTPVNDAPVAAADSYSLTEGTLLTVAVPGVLANDQDLEGSPLTARLIDSPAHGTVTFAVDGSFSYVPAAGFHGADQFTYVANDGELDSSVATVSLTIAAINHAPAATNDSLTTSEDTELTLSAPGLIANDNDTDGDALAASVVSGPAHGSLTLRADGSLSYLPAANFFGFDSFTYQVSDGLLNSNVATVAIDVTPINDAPVAVDDAFETDEGSTLTIEPAGVLANDSDLEGASLSASLVAGPSHGELTLQSNGGLTYVPAVGFAGVDSFTYRAGDGELSSNVATVSITVRAINLAPTASDLSYSIDEDTTLDSAAPGILLAASDPNGDSLSAALAAGPSHGTLTLRANGSFTYVPDANFHGTDSFTFRVNDGSLDSNIATVALNVASINDAPVAANESYVTNEDVALTIALPGVLANDSDLDGDSLSAKLVTAPTHGSLTLRTNGSFTYTPAANYHGPDSFTYRANDGGLDSNLATVSLDVASINDAPVASNDTYSVVRDTTLTIAASGVLANDSDVDGDSLTASLVAGPSHGTVTFRADGSFDYVPAAGYVGPDSVTYRATDGVANSNVATVSINVTLPPAKFFVVDADSKSSFEYAANGSALVNGALNKSNSKPRGIASNADGSVRWVLDSSGTIFVYDGAGASLGNWQPQSVGKPEGITVWGNELWLVDPTGDRVYAFVGGAAVRSGRVNASSSFALQANNLNSTDLVADGSHLWVVNDTLATDAVFRYSTAGAFQGSWTITGGNPSPTGITLDPNNVNHLWIVDASMDRVYQYDGATTRVSGSQAASGSFALAAANTNPQGIADPQPAEMEIVEPKRTATDDGVAERAESKRAARSYDDRSSAIATRDELFRRWNDATLADDSVASDLARSRKGTRPAASHRDDLFAELDRLDLFTGR